jgi:hypothetical protein
MRVYTPTCRMCGSRGLLEDVDAEGYRRWRFAGVNIVEALPDLDADQRELLISGTHAHCWEKMWGPDDAA